MRLLEITKRSKVLNVAFLMHRRANPTEKKTGCFCTLREAHLEHLTPLPLKKTKRTTPSTNILPQRNWSCKVLFVLICSCFFAYVWHLQDNVNNPIYTNERPARLPMRGSNRRRCRERHRHMWNQSRPESERAGPPTPEKQKRSRMKDEERVY